MVFGLHREKELPHALREKKIDKCHLAQKTSGEPPEMIGSPSLPLKMPSKNYVCGGGDLKNFSSRS